MDEDLARIIATAGMKASKELGDLIPLLNDHLPDDRELRIGVATAIAEIGLNVLNPAFERFPALKAEFDRRADKYGRTV